MQNNPRSPEEAEKYIHNGINVTRQMVFRAKVDLLRRSETRTKDLLEKLLEQVEARKPIQVIVSPQVDFLPSLQQVTNWISWTLAGCEAIWEIVHANVRIPGGVSSEGELGSVEWTTVTPGSGGRTSSWNFDSLSLPVPSTLIVPPSLTYARERQPLSDPDIFLKEIGIKGIHPGVEEAILEAVKCFRHELYTACLAMLGKAAEGAWIEVGLALLNSPAIDASLDGTTKLRETLESPTIGIAKKITEVVKLYERNEIFGEVAKRSNVRPQDLRNSTVWADVVRDSRNTVHYGVEPAMSNSYEKVGALLIGAVTHLRILYRVIEAAKGESGN